MQNYILSSVNDANNRHVSVISIPNTIKKDDNKVLKLVKQCLIEHYDASKVKVLKVPTNYRHPDTAFLGTITTDCDSFSETFELIPIAIYKL